MPEVHPSAILDGDINRGDGVVIGPHCVLTGPITIGAGTRLIGNVYLHGPLTLGANNVVYPFSCIGFAPQHLKFDPATPGKGTVIGDDNTFREHTSVHRAFADEHPTRIGNRNYFMANAHVGHDAHVADDCTLVNNAALGGHAVVEKRVTIGGGTSVHQFCRIGTGAMLSGAVGTSADVLPWTMLTGINVVSGVNLIGLRRNGFTREQIGDVRWVYKTLCRSDDPMPQRRVKLEERATASEVVADYVRFLDASQRTIATARSQSARGRS